MLAIVTKPPLRARAFKKLPSTAKTCSIILASKGSAGLAAETSKVTRSGPLGIILHWAKVIGSTKESIFKKGKKKEGFKELKSKPEQCQRRAKMQTNS